MARPAVAPGWLEFPRFESSLLASPNLIIKTASSRSLLCYWTSSPVLLESFQCVGMLCVASSLVTYSILSSFCLVCSISYTQFRTSGSVSRFIFAYSVLNVGKIISPRKVRNCCDRAAAAPRAAAGTHPPQTAQLRRAELNFTAPCRPEAAMAVDMVTAGQHGAWKQSTPASMQHSLERGAAIDAPEPQRAP